MVRHLVILLLAVSAIADSSSLQRSFHQRLAQLDFPVDEPMQLSHRSKPADIVDAAAFATYERLLQASELLTRLGWTDESA